MKKKEPIAVLAVFDIDAEQPRPLRFKIEEDGIMKTVEVFEIRNIERLGAGGMSRYEYTCRSAGSHGKIEYKLLYYFMKSRWEIEKS